MREDGLALDRLLLTLDPAAAPTGVGPAESPRAAPAVQPVPDPTPDPVPDPVPDPTPRPAPFAPYDDLPWNIRRLTALGERAAFSPDGSKIAFMDHQFGDAFEYDLATAPPARSPPASPTPASCACST